MLPRFNRTQAQAFLVACALANRPACLIGPPGVGKSAMGEQIASSIGSALNIADYKPIFLIGSTMEGADFGIPIVEKAADGSPGLRREPIWAIREACEKPALVILDELANVPRDVAAAMLSMVTERRVGDRKLHPLTRIIAFTNHPDDSPAGYEFSPPTLARFAWGEYCPSVEEVQAFMANLADAGIPTLADWAVEYAALLGQDERLLQFDIPEFAKRASEIGAWPNPRQVESMLRTVAAWEGAGLGLLDTPEFEAVVGACIGSEAAAAYLGHRALMGKLATKAEILANPGTARLPQELGAAVAAIAVCAQAALKDPYAAWIYAARLPDEVKPSIAKTLNARSTNGAPTTNKAKGEQAKLSMNAFANKALRGVT